MTARADLCFLGWDRPPVPAAAEHLLEHHGPRLGELLVAVPGARAGRLLLRHLGRAAAARGHGDWTPPRVLTQGRLVDELALVEVPLADRATRTLAWERALRETLRQGRTRLVERPPDLADRPSWWRLAERVRGLHSELAVEGLEFADLAEGRRGRFEDAGEGLAERERERWAVLARVQARWRELLGEAGLADPHDARNAAIDSGRVARDARVALLGVVDAPGLLRRALEGLAAPPLALVIAPESERAGFDELGFLAPEHWAARDLDLPLERWHVVTGPDDQAARAAQLVAASGATRADEVTLGVADEEVVPYLERRFAEDGIRARAAAGRPLERSAPARLLAALARWLEGRRASDAAALVRHPDLDDWLRRQVTAADGAALDAAALLDSVREKHLPRTVGGQDAADALPEGLRSAHRAGMDALVAALDDLAGDLARDRPLPLAAAAGAIRRALVLVYGDVDLAGSRGAEEDAAARARRELREALAALGEALQELEDAPPDVAESARPSAALDLVVRALRGRAVPPAPEVPGEPTIELLGWLELALDDAPHLVVTGFAEGRVPEAVGADPFLPDALRVELGLEDDRRRLARDAYAAAVLLASRDAHFVSARRTRAGDPLFPSRLAFHRPAAEVPERVAHATSPREVVAPARMASAPGYERPALSDYPAPDMFSVTDFKAYLDSPFMYGLSRMLGAEPVDDGARELDARTFGTLVHDALEVLADEELARSTDVGRIEGALLARLDRAVSRRFGQRPLPAVAMQASQARLRLQRFAEWQAERAAAGWIVKHVEWTPATRRGEPREGRRAGTVPIPGLAEPAWLSGKIDRIEQHEDGPIAILDYKTGRRALDPATVRGRQTKDMRAAGEPAPWKDLQLPLYCLLAGAVVGDVFEGDSPHVPAVGYVNLGPSRVQLATTSWSRDVLREALDAARDVVGKIRAGELDELGRTWNLAPLVAELAGVGLIEAPAAVADEDGEEGEES